MEYPKKFACCPNCGSSVRVVEQEALLELSKGNVRPEGKPGVITIETAIFDPGAKGGIIMPREFPVIRARLDVCADCGSLYCVEVDKVTGKATPQIRRDDFRHNPGGIAS